MRHAPRCRIARALFSGPLQPRGELRPKHQTSAVASPAVRLIEPLLVGDCFSVLGQASYYSSDLCGGGLALNQTARRRLFVYAAEFRQPLLFVPVTRKLKG